MSTLGRLVFAFACAATVVCFPRGAAVAADNYPTRPIRLVVPLAAGGAIDVFARVLGKELETSLGQPVLIENRPGANTIIAANACKNAAPDGYTICLLTRSTISINPELYRKLSYGLKDFEPITNLFFGQQVIILSNSVPVKNFAELVTHSKAHPNKLNYGSFGIGGDSHLLVEWLKHTTGADLTHVPYRGAAPALLAFKSGDVQILTLLVGNPDIVRQIRDHEVKGLLTPGAKRFPLIPDVPTFAEAGLSSDEKAYSPWFGMFAPAGTPRDIVAKLNKEIARVVKQKDFQDHNMTPLAFLPVADTPEHFAEFLKNDNKVAAELVRVSGVKLDE